MTLFRTTIAASVFALMAPAAIAAPILIDDFSVFQKAAALPTSEAGSPTIAFGSMFGGSRQFDVVNNAASPGAGGVELTSTGNGQLFQETPENSLNLATDPGVNGVATITYDGRLAINGAGTLAPFDLTNGGLNDKFFFDIIENTPNFVGTTLSTTVVDNDSSFTFVENLGVGFSEFTAFSNFVGIDFTKVTSLAFSLNTNDLPGFDGTIDSISAVPLPASALLLLGGLGGLFGASAVTKRRRKEA